MKNPSVITQDKKFLWHPFTQAQTAEEPLLITRGLNSWIFDQNDNKYLDLISSWWVNLHGHANSYIAEAIYQQSLKLEHVIFANNTHEPAINLAVNLSKILPELLTKYFYSDNGSTAVEVALKMSYQYWLNKGQKNKKWFISFEGGYHGDTIGAMSVGGASGFHMIFQDLFFKVLYVPYPEMNDESDSHHQEELVALEKFKSYISLYKDQICAFIIEPIVQGAGGMRKCSVDFLNKILHIAKNEQILIIFDEVMTGFGRTGKLFALEYLDIQPDFLCLSKGITGGFLPLALTVTTEKIYNAFLSDQWEKAFLHGHSYTANPIACAAANASLALLLQSSDKIDMIHQTHVNGIAHLKQNCSKIITNTRIIGSIAAFDTKFSNDNDRKQLTKRYLSANLLLRPLKNTTYLMPPYSTTLLELEWAYEEIVKILKLSID